jgi:ribosomal-protein-alanine N-acetyltransferase
MRHVGTQPLATERLLLRRLLPADAAQMYRNWACDPAVTRYLRWEPHESAERTRTLLSAWAELYSNLDYYQWAITDKATGEVFGSISVMRTGSDHVAAYRAAVPDFDELDSVIAENGLWEVGYCVGRAWWNKGYTTEALRAVVRFWFGEVKGECLTCCHAVANPASGAVMRKVGFRYTHDTVYHKFDGTPMDCHAYFLRRDAYPANQTEHTKAGQQ